MVLIFMCYKLSCSSTKIWMINLYSPRLYCSSGWLMRRGPAKMLPSTWFMFLLASSDAGSPAPPADPHWWGDGWDDQCNPSLLVLQENHQVSFCYHKIQPAWPLTGDSHGVHHTVCCFLRSPPLGCSSSHSLWDVGGVGYGAGRKRIKNLGP